MLDDVNAIEQNMLAIASIAISSVPELPHRGSGLVGLYVPQNSVALALTLRWICLVCASTGGLLLHRPCATRTLVNFEDLE
jgi:hypothetical protein